MGFGGTTTEPVFDHLDDPSQPLQLSFHYHRVKEKDWGDNRITATFEQISLPAFTADSPPVISIQLGAPRTETSTVEMQLPQGWAAQLPEAVHARTSFATCDVTYRFSEGKLYAERRLVILKAKIPVTSSRQYQSWYDDAGASGVPYIQLFPPPKPVSAATTASPTASELKALPASVQPSDAHAAELVQQAFQQVRAMDLDSARKNLDDAAKINPTERSLWAGYAAVAEFLGKRNESIEDAQREILYHPDETQIYETLSRVQLNNHDLDGALITLRAWAKAAPEAIDPPLDSARLLQTYNRHAEALVEAQSALTRLKNSGVDLAPLTIVAAKAEVDLGHAEQAAAQVFPLLDTVSDPVQINDIAYVLAEANSRLPEAFAAQTRVLAAQEEETTGWTVADDPSRVAPRQITIAQAWDTMAWILYRQGKFAEAFAYEDAARRITNSSTIRSHIADIARALRTPASSGALHDSDQELRTFALGPATGTKGTFQFTLLLANGRIAAFTPRKASDSAPTPSDIENMLKTADLHTLFPPGSKAHLLRTGFANCHETVCELVLAP